MSDDIRTRPRSTRNTNLEPPVRTGKSDPPKQDSKGRQILNCFGRGFATVTRKKESAVETIGDTVQQLSDFANYRLAETDYLRRRQRFDELIEGNKEDARLAEPLKVAAKWTRQIDQALKSDKLDWTYRATMCTVATETLLQGIKEARSGETKARKNHPGVRDGLDQIGKTLTGARQQLTPDEGSGFSEQLNGLQVELCKLADVTPGKKDPPSPLEKQAADLQAAIGKKTKANLEQQNKLRLWLDPLRKRLASAPNGTLDETGSDVRVAISKMLSQADNAIFALDFSAAETALKQAATALDKMGAPQPQDLLKPEALLQGIEGMKKQSGRLLKGAASIPRPGSEELKQRILDVVGRLEAAEFALNKGGDSVLAAAGRTTEECVNSFVEIQETIDSYGEFLEQKGKADEEFKALHAKIGEQAKTFYDELGVSGGGDGALQTQLAEIQERWEAALNTSLSPKELNQAAYLQELNALADQIANDKGDPEQVALEKATSRYKSALSALQTEAKRVSDADSDKAIRLGLTTKPETLRKLGDGLTAGSAALPADERLKQIDAVTEQIVNLTNEAKKFDEKSIAGETQQLREACRQLLDECQRRIKAVLDAVEIERKKTISVGTNKSERDGLTAYGISLQSELDTVVAPVGDLNSDAKVDAGLLGDARDALVGLRRKVADFESLGPNGKADKSLPSFASLEKRIASLTKTLTEHSLFKPRTELTEPWRSALEAMSTNLTGRDPRKTDEELTKLETGVANAKQVAASESKAAGEMVTRLRNFAADVIRGTKGFEGLQDDAPTYRKDLDRRLTKMANDIETADKIQPGATGLVAEAEKAAKAAQGSAGARSQGEVTAKKEQAEYQAARAGLARILEVDLELLEEKAGKLSGQPRKELMKQVKDLRSQANAAITSLEVTRDVAAANTMAEAIGNRVERISDAPLGSSTQARNNLPAVEKRWIKAVDELQKSIEGIPEIVKSACAGDEPAEQAANALAGKLIEPIKRLFRPDAFSPYIKRIGLSDDQGVLTTREEALREVRRLTAMMGSDYRIHLLARVPFPGVVSRFPEVGSALWDLETNLMTSG